MKWQGTKCKFQAGFLCLSTISVFYSPELFEIRKLSSVFLQVKTQIGLQILYDREGLRLYLQVDERWKDDTVGLCGTFNGNTEDDFLYAELQEFYLPVYEYIVRVVDQVCTEAERMDTKNNLF